jgi:NitT/TauT family transport system permease protein
MKNNSPTCLQASAALDKAGAVIAPPRRVLDRATLLPILLIGLTLALHQLIPNSREIMNKPMPYLTALLTVCLVLACVSALISFFIPAFRAKYAFKSMFIAGVFMLINIYNLATLKFPILPHIFFPYPDRILAVFKRDWLFLLDCMANSGRLLFWGVFFGGCSGMLTGIAVGWNKRASYWITPVIRFLGPIPSTALIPIALVAFATTISAGIFLIAVAVWFPTTILTSSGIQNIEKGYFEVASTLGATSRLQILRVALPGALPSMFVGLFNGTCTAFVALMAAEMTGVKSGIGWYIHWKREVLAYPDVYAGLLIIAFSCWVIITGLFKARDHILKWQQGLIRW